MATKKTQAPARIAENKKAAFNYFFEEKHEAGVVLHGWEVKAVREGKVQLTDGYVVIRNGELFLIGCHWGLRVKPNTQSLGEGTTASVVTSITMVIIVDALFAVAFKNIGI